MVIRNVIIVLSALLIAPFAWSDCTKLDDNKMEELLIRASFQAQPGRTFHIRPFIRECCVFETDVKDLCATWSVSPETGLRLNSETGEVTIDTSTAPGSTFDVNVNVQNGQKVLTTKIIVYTPDQNPFVGMWREASQLDCNTGKEFSPARNIQEIEFRADGHFAVTWTPFEIYRDYWGTYTYDLKKGVFEISATSGNNLPKDVDPGGIFVFQSDGSLVLKDFWFGAELNDKTAVPVKACGHRLIRR